MCGEWGCTGVIITDNANNDYMNGMGKDTTVKIVYPYPVTYTRNAAIVMRILFVGCFVMCWKKKQEFLKNNKEG